MFLDQKICSDFLSQLCKDLRFVCEKNVVLKKKTNFFPNGLPFHFLLICQAHFRYRVEEGVLLFYT